MVGKSLTDTATLQGKQWQYKGGGTVLPQF